MESGSSFGGGVSMCDSSNSSLQLAVKVGCATVDTWNSGKHFEVVSVTSLLIHYSMSIFKRFSIIPSQYYLFTNQFGII